MQSTNVQRAVERGFSRVEPSGNVLIAYSARDGTTANDGSGRNSPFTQSLLNNLETPGLEIDLLFRNVRDDVLTATHGEQQPFVYGSLSRQLIYLGRSEVVPPAISGTADETVPRAPSAGAKSLPEDQRPPINWLGIRYSVLLSHKEDTDLAADPELFSKAGRYRPPGILVLDTDGLAKKAGVLPGDIIVRFFHTSLAVIDESDINEVFRKTLSAVDISETEFSRMLEATLPGERAIVLVRREGYESSVNRRDNWGYLTKVIVRPHDR